MTWTKTIWIPQEGRDSLNALLCPYCDADLEGFLFGGEDGRDGGFTTCEHCRLSFAWIDSPFECEVSTEDGEKYLPAGEGAERPEPL